jgi:hypothetical protein
MNGISMGRRIFTKEQAWQPNKKTTRSRSRSIKWSQDIKGLRPFPFFLSRQKPSKSQHLCPRTSQRRKKTAMMIYHKYIVSDHLAFSRQVVLLQLSVYFNIFSRDSLPACSDESLGERRHPWRVPPQVFFLWWQEHSVLLVTHFVEAILQY